MAFNNVSLVYSYYPDPEKSQAISEGDAYVGNPDTDPEIGGNQKQVYHRQENGSDVPVSQPLQTGAGGVILINGSPAQIVVDGNYSLKVLDKNGAQKYYDVNRYNGEPITTDTLPAAGLGAEDSIADLRDYDVSALSGNERIFVSGYYSPDSGGGGVFYWDATSTTADDGGATILPTGHSGAGRWIRIWDGMINVAWFGAKADGATDDTPSIQAAMDYAQTVGDAIGPPSDFSGYPSLEFENGIYAIGSTIIWKTASFVGDSTLNSGTRFLWTGTAGGTMIEKFSGVHSGGNSFGRIENICFRGDGGSEPATFIDFTTSDTTIDTGMILTRTQFFQCSDIALKIGRWTNLHWSEIRWDRVGTYAMELTPLASQNTSSFSISNWSYDNGGTGRGFIKVDNSAGSTNVGTIALRNARFELNGAWTGEKALVYILYSTTGVRTAPVLLDNVAFATSSATGNYIIYRTSPGGNGGESLKANAIIFNAAGDWTFFGGDIDNTVNPAVDNYDFLSLATTAENAPSGYSSMTIFGNAAAGFPFRYRRDTDTTDRIRIQTDGAIKMGDGTAATDVDLRRQTAGVFRGFNTLIVSDPGVGVGSAPNATTPGSVIRRIEVFDSAGSSLGFIAVYNSIT